MDDHPSTDRAYDTRGNPPPPGASPGRRVLVIEDLADARDSLRVLLEAALEVEVDVAADGTEGLEMIARRLQRRELAWLSGLLRTASDRRIATRTRPTRA